MKTDYINELRFYFVQTARCKHSVSVQVQKIDVSVTNSKHDLLDKHVQNQFIVGRTNPNLTH